MSYSSGSYLSKCCGCIQVTSFIREESKENMQIIVISLKEEFFSKSDALLGVYSDVTHFTVMLLVGQNLIYLYYDNNHDGTLLFTVQ